MNGPDTPLEDLAALVRTGAYFFGMTAAGMHPETAYQVLVGELHEPNWKEWLSLNESDVPVAALLAVASTEWRTLGFTPPWEASPTPVTARGRSLTLIRQRGSAVTACTPWR